jgi:hypothetical protein
MLCGVERASNKSGLVTGRACPCSWGIGNFSSEIAGSRDFFWMIEKEAVGFSDVPAVARQEINVNCPVSDLKDIWLTIYRYDGDGPPEHPVQEDLRQSAILSCDFSKPPLSELPTRRPAGTPGDDSNEVEVIIAFLICKLEFDGKVLQVSLMLKANESLGMSEVLLDTAHEVVYQDLDLLDANSDNGMQVDGATNAFGLLSSSGYANPYHYRPT